MPESIKKPAHEVALLLTLKPNRTEAGAKIAQVVLFRIEVGMWIEEAIKE